MANLVHLIYCSTATRSFSNADLLGLLRVARERNRELGVTGMLLYENGGFFQVIEGEAATIDELYAMIESDPRHHRLIKIIHEPVARRAFADWTMGFSRISADEVREVSGVNDFFTAGDSLLEVDAGRAKKILAAFRRGRWRARLEAGEDDSAAGSGIAPQSVGDTLARLQFSFQPVVDTERGEIFSHAVTIRGGGNETYPLLLRTIHPTERAHFESECRTRALRLAAGLGLDCRLTLDSVDVDPNDILRFTLDTAAELGIAPERIVLEIDLDRCKAGPDELARAIDRFQSGGMRAQLGQFVSGHGMLELLERAPPDLVSLNTSLVRKIDSDPARQALILAIAEVCRELGIGVIASHVERAGEYRWLRDNGFALLQGDFVARATQGSLAAEVILP